MVCLRPAGLAAFLYPEVKWTLDFRLGAELWLALSAEVAVEAARHEPPTEVPFAGSREEPRSAGGCGCGPRGR